MRTMPMGPYPVEVSLCLNEADWRRGMRTVSLRDSGDADWPCSDEAAVTKIITLDDDSIWLIAVFTPQIRKLPLHERFGLICHEAVHVWQEVRDHMLVKAADCEIEAYSVQWYAEFFTKQLHAEGWLKP
jgi:hypothetical protein